MEEQGQRLFKAALEKHFSPEDAAQMLGCNQLFHELLAGLPENPGKLLDLQAGYWQELSLIWQRLMLNGLAAGQDSFMRDYYRLHQHYFQNLLKVAGGLNQEQLLRVKNSLKALSPEELT